MPSDTFSSQHNKILLEPFTYLKLHPGKEIRTKLIQAFQIWLKVPEEQLLIITEVIEMLHTASLLIDDVEDNSILRRGIPVAHKIYGIPSTINCANYVYFLALEKIQSLQNLNAIRIFTEELLNLHKGQGMDIYWRDTCTCPSDDEYMEMISHKTGGLFRLAVKLMQEFSQETKDFSELVTILGQHFQIRDDYVNLQSEKYMESKSFCEDLTEGKFSYPIIHSIHTSEIANSQLWNILKQRTTDVDIKKYAVEIMKSTDSFSQTLKKAGELENKARHLIEAFGGNHILTEILDKLSVLNIH